MHPPDLIIRGRKVVLSDPQSNRHNVGPAAIQIRNGRIASITAYEDVLANVETVDADDESLVMAGFGVTHVHLDEPGRTNWEGFATAACADVGCGVSLFVDM